MKSKEFMKEVAQLTADQLRVRARDMSEELMKLRFRQSSGQLEHSHRLRELKRNTARVQTLISASNSK